MKSGEDSVFETDIEYVRAPIEAPAPQPPEPTPETVKAMEDAWLGQPGITNSLRAVYKVVVESLERCTDDRVPEPLTAGELPEPAFWIAQEAKRHGMHPAYRSSQARQKYGGDGWWEGFYSAKQVEAVVKADRAARAALGGTDDRRSAEAPTKEPLAAQIDRAWKEGWLKGHEAASTVAGIQRDLDAAEVKYGRVIRQP